MFLTVILVFVNVCRDLDVQTEGKLGLIICFWCNRDRVGVFLE